jgi:hypothetical protein
MNRFPDFAKDAKRPFAVHENCYDCAAFYGGCEGWRAPAEFRCDRYQPLPDVMPRPWPQPFSRKRPWAQSHGPRQKPHERRTCECGESLAKGKRLCDECRTKRRRTTMRTYVQNRRRSLAESTTSISSAQKPRKRASLAKNGRAADSESHPLRNANFCITKSHLKGATE